jgi:hypothetical protein
MDAEHESAKNAMLRSQLGGGTYQNKKSTARRGSMGASRRSSTGARHARSSITGPDDIFDPGDEEAKALAAEKSIVRAPPSLRNGMVHGGGGGGGDGGGVGGGGSVEQPYASPSEEPHPEHIEKRFDENKGSHYYFNTSTQVSTWTLEEMGGQPAAVASDTRRKGSGANLFRDGMDAPFGITSRNTSRNDYGGGGGGGGGDTRSSSPHSADTANTPIRVALFGSVGEQVR